MRHLGVLPSLFLFVFGRYIDRYAKKTILIVCEIGQALCVSGVAVAMVIFRQNPGVILGLSFLSAMFGVNSYPTQDALLPQIVSQKELPQAASYMAFAYNGVSYFFNALTGFILHVFSVLSLVVTDVLTFLVSACFFGRLKHNQADTTTAKTEVKAGRTDWSTGFKVILRRPSLVILTVFTVIMNFLFGGLDVYQVLLAKRMGGPQYLGLLEYFSAIGILVGSTVLANWLSRKFALGTLLVASSIGFALLMAPIVLIANHYIFVAYYGLVFVALGVEQTAQAPIMQSMLSKDLLGRVMGAYYTFTLFAMGLGGLLFGLIGGSLSPKIFLLIFSGAMLVTGLAFAANSELRKYAIREE
ncbi:MFS transporter [Levilactobacillus suantsaiihabitans]|uniref:MFS transporter n=1 Tax=Levilactobacillus suantsaiihabitans TaxID=2487722 RepID=A0A4Z0J8V3_9LACO|nr:MFS transporter [Levilactobacillus suantsaiihabitans]